VKNFREMQQAHKSDKMKEGSTQQATWDYPVIKPKRKKEC
jgi:hypothetical protein